MIALPIDELLPRVVETLTAGRNLVLTAPPGTGKSTRVPAAIARAFPGQVYLLQPRRIAAKTLARRIGEEQPGWRLGREVGYRVRFEKSGDAGTRLWVMTEGSLTRQLQADPYLEGIGTVILDEFHERSLHTDLALAYLRELQTTVRDDLRVVVMSATMDAAPVAAFLGCEAIAAEARMFPVVSTHWQGAQDLALADIVARAVDTARADPACGDILVFLPGAGEIRTCERALSHLQGEVDVLPLHGSLSAEDQDRALTPGARPRVVLATNVAETSVTIPGVRTVIDSGLVRVVHHSPLTGLEELRREPISRASALQRAGRAGRTAPGRCIRLWTPLADARLASATAPEVRRVDLAPACLALKLWNHADSRRFPWFEAPEPERLRAAEDLLSLLGCTAASYETLTPLGARLATLPVHPRLARLMHAAAGAQAPHLGATLAALASERDVRLPRRPNDAPVDPAPTDAQDRLEALGLARRGNYRPHLRDQGIDPMAASQVARAIEDLLSAWHGGRGASLREREAEPAPELICRLLLAAFPDRVARRSAADPNRATMLGGVAVEIDRGSALWSDPRAPEPRSPLLVVVDAQELERSGRPTVIVRQAAEIDEALLDVIEPGVVRREEQMRYDAERGRVVSWARWLYRDLCIREAAGSSGDAGAASACLAEALRPQATALFAEDEVAGDWLARARWLRARMPALALPEFDDAVLAEVVGELCAGCTTRAEVAAKAKLPWLHARLSREQARAVDEHAPSHLAVPTGNRIRLDYTAGEIPVLAVRLQELFGLPATPRIAGGSVAVLLHLLAPNYRVEQVTSDLASFWANTYSHVRKDLRGRYPKHSWPEDPLTAPPQARGRPRQ